MTQRLLDPRMFDSSQALPAMSGANLTGVPQSMNIVSEGSATSVATLDFTGLTYQYHILYMWDFNPVSSAEIYMRVSYDNGSTFISDADYYWTVMYDKTDGGYNVSSTAADTVIRLSPTGADDLATGANNVLRVEFDRNAGDDGTLMYGTVQGAIEPAGYAPAVFTGAFKDNSPAGDIDAIRIYMSTGNISRVSYKLFGFNNL